MRIFDLHNDVLTKSPKKAKTILKRNQAVLAVWTTRLNNPLDVCNKASTLTNYWAIEDLGFCRDISEFNYKPLYASLTWNEENQHASGALVEGGLKPSGKKAIEKLESLGVALDMAHLNRESFFMAVETAKKPFICSHTCFEGVFSHKRNLDNEQILLIIQSGGVIGLTFVPDFMGVLKASAKDIIKQIEYFCARFPLENLSIGSDFFGTDSPALKNYTGFRTLKKELIKLNYTKFQIDKIFYKNAYDFWAR